MTKQQLEAVIAKQEEYISYLKRAIHSESIIDNITAGVRDKFDQELSALQSIKQEEEIFTGRSERIIKQKHCFGALCPYSTDPRSQCEWFDPEGEIFTCFTNKQPGCMCQGINCGHFKQIKYNFTTGI